MTSTNRLVSIAKIASTTDQIPPTIMRFMLQSAARELLPNERVAKCLRAIVPTAQRVQIHKSKVGKSAHYRNLITCGRIWHCPICASKISEERRRELSSASHKWPGGLALVTYTTSHSSSSPLSSVLARVLTAHRSLKSGRWFKELTEYYGWVGSVKSLEITYGKNGWHPHIHELVFFTNPQSEELAKMFESNIAGQWKYELKKLNAYASTERGVTVATSDADVSDYVSKYGEIKTSSQWSFAHELTKQTVKRGKLHGETPTQLLYDYMMGSAAKGKLWQEYANVLKGRHQLVWSRGLRDMLGFGREQSDDEIAQKQDENSYLLAELTRGQWHDVLVHNDVGEIIYAAQTKDDETFKDWLILKLASYQE